jgi:hypothetical protein
MKKAWLALLLTACAAPHWEKPGAAPDQAEADLKQCEASAPLVPQGRTPAGPRTKPGSNTIDFDSASERAFDRMRKDDEHIAACMRTKGYVR